MKNKLLLSAAMLFITCSSFATLYTVTVGPSTAAMTFSPATSISMHPGDTIKWVWATGTHTTTSTSIPAGAATWTQNINSTTTSFIYVPTVVGTYNYQCNFHASMGMTGSFTVISSTGVAEVSNKAPVFSMYPNPATGSVHILFNHPGVPATITLTDMSGKEAIRKTYKALKEADIDLNNIPNGNYIIAAVQGRNAYRQQLVVAH